MYGVRGAAPMSFPLEPDHTILGPVRWIATLISRLEERYVEVAQSDTVAYRAVSSRVNLRDSHPVVTGSIR